MPLLTDFNRSDAASMKPVLAFGDLAADIIVKVAQLPLRAGEHQTASHFSLEPGGSGNFLIMGARLGAPMAAIGTLGDDLWGREVKAILAAEAVDMTGVRFSGSTTRVVTAVGGREHIFLGTYGEGQVLELTAADHAVIADCAALFVAGYSLVDSRLSSATLEVIRVAHHLQVPLYFDPGPHIFNVAPHTVRAVLALVDTILLTKDELALMGIDNPEALLATGVRSVVLKQGPAGCSVTTAAGTAMVAGYEVDVVDTSAAGDSFAAAFIFGRQKGWDDKATARFANAVGAAKVQKLGGGRNVPTRDEVAAVIEQFNINLPS